MTRDASVGRLVELVPAPGATFEPADVESARVLFREYAASIGFSLDFQSFEQELLELPGRYAPPAGCIFLARVDGELAGSVALRKLDDDVCEMKRLFVRPQFQGLGVGRRLTEAVVAHAKRAGYVAMRLDTVPAMKPAIALYESLGFRDIAQYTENPMPGARFLELALR